MAESLALFVRRRRPDWDQLSHCLDEMRKGTVALPQLVQLDRLYREATSDLARVNSLYPNTDVARFLNQVCARAYGAIYRPAPPSWASVTRFYRRTFPAALRDERAFLLASVSALLIGLAFGALAIALEPLSAELLVPPAVREAVAEKRMWTDSLLSAVPPEISSAAIATNNLSVTIAAFVFGISLGLGTVYVLLSNGVSLGAITAYCVQHGMSLPLFSFIGAHGPVELSIIAVSGAAGLMLAEAIINPGEAPRLRHLRLRALKGVQLLIGCAPMLVIAGLLEGFVDPGTLIPASVKIGLGLVLGALFWTYLLSAGRHAEAPQERDAGAD